MTELTIVSGGQTGVDRAALDAALGLGLRIGGWVPKGRWTEDGALSARYRGLRETASLDPSERTRRNVHDSDATLVFTRGPLTGGSRLTFDCAAALGRPVLVIDLAATEQPTAVRTVCGWLRSVRPERLNVAGPRESEAPSIYAVVKGVLRAALNDRQA